MRIVPIDSQVVPAIGMGTSHLSEGPNTREELDTLRRGISLGMTVIDTAEVYNSGRCEALVGSAIAGQRDKVFLVSKVWHTNIGRIEEACEESLKRLGTDYLDLYLLHWPGGLTNFSGVVESFGKLRTAGKILAWGVSNFNGAQIKQLLRSSGGEHCATNQIPYNLFDRKIERSILPLCEREGIPVMAYSPLGGPDAPVVTSPILIDIANKRGVSPAAVVLAWTVRSGNVIAIPKASSVEHVKQNAAALDMYLTEEETEALNNA